MASPETRHLSILLTDIKGFTDKTSHKTRADIQAMLDEHRAIVLPILEGKGGKLIKTIGDAFLMTFESPTNAVLAGVAVQDALAKRNEGMPADDRLEIRIAINAGEVNLAEGDVFGEPVNITARIEGIAEAGQVYFTEAVYLAMNKAEVPSSEIGLMQLKAIPAGAAAAALPKSSRRAIALCIDLAICSIILGMLTGHEGRKLRIKKLASPPDVSVDDKGMKVDAPGAKLNIDDNGIHGQAGNTNIAIDDNGIHVNPAAKPQTVVYQNANKSVKVSVDDDDPEDKSDEGGSMLKRLMSGAWDSAILWAIYNLLFLKWLDGGSPGKLLMKLKVIAVNGQPLDKRQRWLRALFSLVSLHAAFIGYLWALWEPQRRTWHDLIAGTRVVPTES